LGMLTGEIKRYLAVYGLHPEGSVVSRLKLLVLVVYAAAFAFVGYDARLRRQFGALLILAGVYMAALAAFESYKVQWYVLYVVPFFGAITAVAVYALNAGRLRRVVWATLAALICMQIGGVLRLIARNTYRYEYLPAIQFLKANTGPGTLVMASSQFGFGYGFSENLLDDIRLGYGTGKQPDVVVVDSRYLEAFQHFEHSEPEVHRFVMNYLKTQCEPVAVSASCTIYVRRRFTHETVPPRMAQ